MRQEGTVISGGCTGTGSSSVVGCLLCPHNTQNWGAATPKPSKPHLSHPAQPLEPAAPCVTPSGAMPVEFFTCKHLKIQVFGRSVCVECCWFGFSLALGPCLEADIPPCKGESLHSSTLQAFLVPTNIPFRGEFAFCSHLE